MHVFIERPSEGPHQRFYVVFTIPGSEFTPCSRRLPPAPCRIDDQTGATLGWMVNISFVIR